MRFFEVKYSTGEVVKITAVPRSKLLDLIALQKSLLTTFLYQGGLLGELLRPDNELVWGDIRSIVSMLPIIGKKKLNLDLIEDCDRLIEIFFTTSTNRDELTGAVIPPEGDRYAPSEIAKLHGLNFFEHLWSAREEAIKMFEKDRLGEEKQEELQLTTLQAETPMLIASPS